MLFNSITYIFIFLPIVFTVYFLLNQFKLYNFSKFFLLIASLYFYGCYKWEYVYIIIVSILLNFIVSRLYNFKYKKLTLIFGLAGNLFLLFYFKYFNYLIEVFANTSFSSITAFKVIMPLGISFFTLQQISFLIDCYRGKIKDVNILDYSLFVCFFPQLVAGPIVRYSEMIPQFQNIKNKIINNDNIYIGLFILTIGLIKKTVFADGFSPFINYMSYHEVYTNFFISWLLGICELLKMYFDFSGYCDIAIASAFFFNIRLPWNFNSPFRVTSIIDYWKRWNMTLIRFLREYLYKPLIGNRTNEIYVCSNIVFIFVLIGLWGGLNFTNIFYGLVNGFGVCINKFWNKLNINLNKIIATLITFCTLVVSVQFLIPRNLSSAFNLVKSMFGFGDFSRVFHIDGVNLVFNAFSTNYTRLNLLLFFSALIIIFYFKNSNQLAKLYVKANNLFYTFLLVIAFVVATLYLTKSSEFLYFIF